MAWQAVPPGDGVATQRRRGRPALVAWDPVPVSLRANRPYNPPLGIQLRLICGVPTDQDRRAIAGAGGDINTQQLALVAEAIDTGALEVVPLDLEALRGDLPAVEHPINIERWDTGYQAWASRLEGLGPAQLSVRVESGRLVDVVRTGKSARVRLWELETVPPLRRGADRARVTNKGGGGLSRRLLA